MPEASAVRSSELESAAMAELTQAEKADLARATERYSESGRRTEQLLHQPSTYTR